MRPFAVLLAAMTTTSSLHWTERKPMPQAEAGGASGVLDEELVIAGGTAWKNDVKLWLDDVQVYDPRGDAWRAGPRLPHAMAYGPSVTGTSGLEVFGGTDGQRVFRESWVLERPTAKWKKSGEVPGDVLLGRAARVNGQVYLFGGCPDAADLTKCSDAVWRRGSKGVWERVASIPDGPVALPAIATKDDSVFLFGGCSMPQPGKVVNHAAVYRYSARSGHWKRLTDLPHGIRGASAYVHADGRVYIFGGYADAGFTADVQAYDITSNSWSKAGSMPVAMIGIDFHRIGPTLFGAGGEHRMRERSARTLELRIGGTAR